MNISKINKLSKGQVLVYLLDKVKISKIEYIKYLYFYNNISYYMDGGENQQSQSFGNRFQIGLGYIF